MRAITSLSFLSSVLLVAGITVSGPVQAETLAEQGPAVEIGGRLVEHGRERRLRGGDDDGPARRGAGRARHLPQPHAPSSPPASPDVEAPPAPRSVPPALPVASVAPSPPGAKVGAELIPGIGSSSGMNTSSSPNNF